MREESAQIGQPFTEPESLEDSGVKEAYDHVTEQINAGGKFKKDVTCGNLLEDLLHEKSFDLNRFTT